MCIVGLHLDVSVCCESQAVAPRLCDCLAKGDAQQMDVTFCRQAS